MSVCMPSLQKENEEAVQIQNMEAIKVISSLLQVKIPSHCKIKEHWHTQLCPQIKAMYKKRNVRWTAGSVAQFKKNRFCLQSWMPSNGTSRQNAALKLAMILLYVSRHPPDVQLSHYGRQIWPCISATAFFWIFATPRNLLCALRQFVDQLVCNTASLSVYCSALRL